MTNPPSPNQILPYLLLFVYFGSVARDMAAIFRQDAKAAWHAWCDCHSRFCTLSC